MTPKTGRTYCIVRRIVAYRDLDTGGSSPMGSNKGPTVTLPMGTRVCVGWGKGGKWSLMTTTTRALGPVWAWIDAEDLVPEDKAADEGLQPCWA